MRCTRRWPSRASKPASRCSAKSRWRSPPPAPSESWRPVPKPKACSASAMNAAMSRRWRRCAACSKAANSGACCTWTPMSATAISAKWIRRSVRVAGRPADPRRRAHGLASFPGPVGGFRQRGNRFRQRRARAHHLSVDAAVLRALHACGRPWLGRSAGRRQCRQRHPVELRALRTGRQPADAQLRPRQYRAAEFRGLGRRDRGPRALSLLHRAIARQYPHSRRSGPLGGGGRQADHAVVSGHRRHMQHEKEQVALTSIAASAALTIAKGRVGVATCSLAILSEAGHSLIDLGATVMTYAAVRISGKPADADHQYGHGKFESVSALAETALLFLLSGVVIWEAVKRLTEHEEHMVIANAWAFGVIVVSIAVDFFRSRALSRTAKETRSQALEADALHFSSDLWASFAVLIGLGGVRFGLWWADSAAALAVAILICIAGWRLGRRTIDTLTDVAPEGAAEKITPIAAKVSGVVAVEQVRARAVGETTFIDLTVAVSRTLPLDRVTAIKDAVAAAIRTQIPGAEPIVTTDPVALNNETVLDRVMVIARNRALAVHHVTVH